MAYIETEFLIFLHEKINFKHKIMIKVKEFTFVTILILLCIFGSSTGRCIDYGAISRGDGDHHRVHHVHIPANPYSRGCEASQRCRRKSLFNNIWNYFIENNVNTDDYLRKTCNE